MENRYGLCRVWMPTENEEFQEEDIWEIIQESDKSPFSMPKTNSSSYEPFTISNPIQTAPKMIENVNAVCQQQKQPKRFTHHSSAPMNIPDWSRKSRNNRGDNNNNDDEGGDSGFLTSSWENDDDEDDGEGNLIPPHELIAKRRARKRISSFSVCEGAGRTLKGRDLSRVRNAVLIRTGFLESNSNF